MTTGYKFTLPKGTKIKDGKITTIRTPRDVAARIRQAKSKRIKVIRGGEELMHWHVLTCPPQGETKAEEFLTPRITDILIPRQTIHVRRRLRSGKGVSSVVRDETRSVPIFGRYLFVRCHQSIVHALIRESRDRGLDVLTGCLHGDNGPASVPDHHIAYLREIDGRQINKPRPFRSGDRVRVRLGVVGEADAVLTRVRGDQATALMAFLGSLREVRFAVSDIVERVA